MLITYTDHVYMPITFERVCAAGGFDVGRSLFVVSQQLRAGTVTHRRCFRDIPGHNKPQGAEKGQNLTKERLPKLRRDGGVYPRANMPKRGTCSYPTCDNSRSPAIHSGGKKKLCVVGRILGSSTNAADFDFESI